MSEFNIHWLPDENIILEYVPADFNIRHDTVPSNRYAVSLLDAAPAPVPYILDVTDIQVSFSDMVSVMAEGTRGDAAAYTHPNVLELLVVTQNSLIKLGARAIQQTQYGNVRARVFATYNEALAYARMIAPDFQHHEPAV